MTHCSAIADYFIVICTMLPENSEPRQIINKSRSIILGSANKIRFFVSLRCKASDIILPLDSKYSMRYVISDINYCK